MINVWHILYRSTKQVQRHPHREITEGEAVLRISDECGGYDGDAVDAWEWYVLSFPPTFSARAVFLESFAPFSFCFVSLN